jgi:hypothetical protein
MKAISLGAAAIYEKCSFLARGFASVKFIHCPRESNGVAHILACNAKGSQSIVWLEDPSEFLISHLANDVNLFDN